jgi:hypothetical protein
MYSLSNFKNIYNGVKEGKADVSHDVINEFMVSKFPETAAIFKKFDIPSCVEFIKNTRYEIYEDEASIFEKGTECSYYIFILNGKVVHITLRRYKFVQ